MNWMRIKGYCIDYEGGRVEIAESGKAERIIESLRWYVENSIRSSIEVTTELEN